VQNQTTNFIEVNIGIGETELHGNLTLLDDSKGIIIFSHGTASSRFSPRNNHIAEQLHEHGFSTLLFDLLTPNEYLIDGHRYNCALMTKRLEATANWLRQYPKAKDLSIGFFGSCTGAASAINAAVDLNKTVKAIVSRGGRVDLARSSCKKLTASTLLIVGELDTEVIEYNRDVYPMLKGDKRMEIIEGASHLFEEEGKLQEVADLATDWFDKHLN